MTLKSKFTEKEIHRVRHKRKHKRSKRRKTGYHYETLGGRRYRIPNAIQRKEVDITE